MWRKFINNIAQFELSSPLVCFEHSNMGEQVTKQEIYIFTISLILPLLRGFSNHKSKLS